MNRDRRLATVEITRLLHELESSVDTTLIKGSELTSGLLESRMSTKIAASVGQEAFMDVISALEYLTQARSKVISAHNALSQIRSDLGLNIFAAGDLTKLAEPKGQANDLGEIEISLKEVSSISA